MSGYDWHVGSASAADGEVLSVGLTSEDREWLACLKRDGCLDLYEAGGHADALRIHLCDGVRSLDEWISRLQNLRTKAIVEFAGTSKAWLPPEPK